MGNGLPLELDIFLPRFVMISSRVNACVYSVSHLLFCFFLGQESEFGTIEDIKNLQRNVKSSTFHLVLPTGILSLVHPRYSRSQ